jgi:TRAP-type C4-dicarboxylate transport system permease small subunit
VTEPVSTLPRLKAAVDRALGAALVVIMGALVLDVLWQVFTRFVLRDPSGFTDELARYLLIWVGLLGAAYVAGQRAHLAIDLLPRRLEGRSAHALGLLIQLVVIAFAVAVLGVGGARLVGLTVLLGQTSAALGLSLAWVYAVLPLSGTLLTFYGALFAMDHLRALRGETSGAGD